MTVNSESTNIIESQPSYCNLIDESLDNIDESQPYHNPVSNKKLIPLK